MSEPIEAAKPRILVVDDDPDLLHLISLRLSVAGYEVIQAESGEQALQRVHEAHPQAVITDLRMEGMDGHALFARLHAETPSLPVIILTAHGTIPDAVAATQRGVFGFLTKPFDGKELLERVAAAVAVSPPVAAEDGGSAWRRALVSTSPVMDELLRQARRLADDPRPLLILGPDGSGKASLAAAIHQASERATKAFVIISSSVLETEQVEAALTPGSRVLNEAQGGTLFVDELSLLSGVAQARLLSLLHVHHDLFGRTRGMAKMPRIIASSKQPLDRVVRDNRLRGDLYYQISAASLRVPSLAERAEDIPLLVAHFLEQHGTPTSFSPEAMTLIQESNWPGNVRQLESVVEQALRLSVTPVIPASLVQRLLGEASAAHIAGFDEERRAFEKEYLERLLKLTAGNVARAARIAERNRTEFYKLLARHGIDPASFK